MTIGEREAALRRLIESYREQECQRLRERAAQRIERLLRRTRRQGRRQLHQRVLEERGRAVERLRAAEAREETQMRRDRQRVEGELLATTWPGLRSALLRRWRHPPARRHWVARYVGEAKQRFPDRQWLVRHPPDWPREERAWLAGELCRGLEPPPLLESEPVLEAGIVIVAGDVRLDASIDGLLSDRLRLQARLLALLKEGRER